MLLFNAIIYLFTLFIFFSGCGLWGLKRNNKKNEINHCKK